MSERPEDGLPTDVEQGLVAENFSQAMKVFVECTTAKGLALWLRHPNRLLGDRSPLEVLEDDPQGYEKVAEAARMWADSEGLSTFNPDLLEDPPPADGDL